VEHVSSQDLRSLGDDNLQQLLDDLGFEVNATIVTEFHCLKFKTLVQKCAITTAYHVRKQEALLSSIQTFIANFSRIVNLSSTGGILAISRSPKTFLFGV